MECPPPQLHRRRRRPEAWIPALEAPTPFHFLVFVHGQRRLLSRPKVAPFPADGFRASSPPSETDATPPHLALLLEVEGVAEMRRGCWSSFLTGLVGQRHFPLVRRRTS